MVHFVYFVWAHFVYSKHSGLDQSQFQIRTPKEKLSHLFSMIQFQPGHTKIKEKPSRTSINNVKQTIININTKRICTLYMP